jgi:hypothetical protein
MANKTLKFSISAGDVRRASVNGVRLPLTNGKGEKSLPPGGHRIQWFVEGVPGVAYDFEVTAPNEAKVKESSKIGSDGKDAGFAKVTINP